MIKTEKYGDATPRTDAYAADTLREVAAEIETVLQPAARGKATANTLREMAGIVPERMILFPLDIAHACAKVGVPRDDQDPRVTSRRRTCAEISEVVQRHWRGGVVGNMPSDDPALWRWRRVLAAVVGRWSGSEDSRLAAIAATAARELAELGGAL
jgi:hypothetical protein